MHVAAIHLVHAYFPSGSHGRGQALYSSMSFGLGGMLGSLVSGTLWDELGARQVFCGASAVCLLALVIAWVWVRTNEGED
jgi:PPP family 3-phenylpropionic acid transporter